MTAPVTPTDLREMRAAGKWSQAELAELLGVAMNTVSRWERGEITPPPYLRFAIAWLLAQTMPMRPTRTHMKLSPLEKPDG